jgi:hypothetical protein
MRDKLLTCFLFAAVFLALGSTALATTTWYVNGVSGSDSNSCLLTTTACKTIGHAISLAASGDTIKVAAATYSENLHIRFSLKLIGSGANTTIIDGEHFNRVVTISSKSAQVTLSRFTIRNGFAHYGGGVYNSGTLIIIASTFSGNLASKPCQGILCFVSYVQVRGGGLYNSGTVTIDSSTFSGNRAGDFGCESVCSARGGGIFSTGALTINNSTFGGNNATFGTQYICCVVASGGGIDSIGALTINNSTFSANDAAACIHQVCKGHGGGIASRTLTINNSTISGNSANRGGGIASGAATLQNSIVANNSSENCYGTMTSHGYNLSSDNTCNFDNAGDLNNTDPLLGPLQNNGGPTQTMALPSGSPAVDAGNPNGCTDSLGHLLKTDQRGKPRPDTEDTGGCDMGAYERQSD